MSELVCNTNGTENQILNGQLSPGCVTLDDITLQKDGARLPLQKRPRLLEKASIHEAVNGCCKSFSSGESSDVLNEIANIRHSFDLKLKNAIKSKLTTYLKSIEDAGTAVNSLRDDLTQLTNRMEFIEKASKDLTKLVMEKVPLVTPTNGMGEHRTLSSQAPRLPPPPPLVSAPDHPVPVTTVANLPVRNPVNVPKLASPAKSFAQVSQSNTHLNPTSQTVPATVVAVQFTDTIDLTSDIIVDQNQLSYSTVGNGTAYTPSNNNQNVAFLSYLPNGTVANLSAQSPTLYKLNQNQSYALATVDQNSYALPNQMKNSQYNSSQITLIPDLHLLPVAQLPPVPPNPHAGLHYMPVQPTPQLTIAEATEGVCLQWSIVHSIGAFEPAKSYEIYSYASSEVTMATLKTYFPWKKVGEVTALPLPMACTLTHVQANNMYYFIVRSIDRLRRYSSWSNVVNAYVS